VNDDVGVSRSWDSITEVIEASTRKSLGYYEFKQNKSWFDELCSKLLDRKKQAKLRN